MERKTHFQIGDKTEGGIEDKRGGPFYGASSSSLWLLLQTQFGGWRKEILLLLPFSQHLAFRGEKDKAEGGGGAPSSFLFPPPSAREKELNAPLFPGPKEEDREQRHTFSSSLFAGGESRIPRKIKGRDSSLFSSFSQGKSRREN